MSLSNVFDIAGSALTAQSVRLNTISSNLANVDTTATNPEDVYQARYPVFSTVYENSLDGQTSGSVRVEDVVEGNAAPLEIFDPNNPLANEDGYIYKSNINAVDEMVNMISASRTYQSSIEAMNTTRELMVQTLSLGRGN